MNDEQKCDQLYHEWLGLMRSQYEASPAEPLNMPHVPGTSIDTVAIRAEIESYQEGLDLLQRKIRLRKSFISPLRIHPLPSETVCRIFDYCRLADPRSPLIITHVCRTWRQTAIQHRALWNGIELGWEEEGLARASAWMERSNPLPVDLTIRHSAAHPLTHLIIWLKFHQNRLESLSILDNSDPETTLLSGNPYSLLPVFPQLKSLKIVAFNVIIWDWRAVGRLALGSHDFTSLSLTGISWNYQLDRFEGAGSSIMHICIGELSYDYPMPAFFVVRLLSICPKLQSFECHATTEGESGGEDKEPSLVSLTFLMEVSIGDGPRTPVLLKHLNAPQLHTLRIFRGSAIEDSGPLPGKDLESFTPNVFWDCIRALHLHCSPPLTKMIFDHTPMPVQMLLEKGWEELPEFCSALEELVFDRSTDPCATGPLLRLLQNPQGPLGGAMPFPGVQRLSFTSFPDLQPSDLLEIITQRLPPFAHPITDLRVEDCAKIYGKELSFMQKLVAQGRRETKAQS